VQVEPKHAGERFRHWDRLSAMDIRGPCGVRTMAVVFSAAFPTSGWAYSSSNVDGGAGGAVSGPGRGGRWTRRCSTMRSPPKDTITRPQCDCFGKQTASGRGEFGIRKSDDAPDERSVVRSIDHLVTKRP
jgi:hypothetical protein